VAAGPTDRLEQKLGAYHTLIVSLHAIEIQAPLTLGTVRAVVGVLAAVAARATALRRRAVRIHTSVVHGHGGGRSEGLRGRQGLSCERRIGHACGARAASGRSCAHYITMRIH
jgi:hypothetical protein